MSIFVKISDEDASLKGGETTRLSSSEQGKLRIAYVGNSSGAVKFGGKVQTVAGDKVTFSTACVGAVMTRTFKNLVFVDEPEFERLSAAEHKMREKMTADGMSVTSAEDWRKISREVTDADKAAGMASIDVKNVHV